MNAIYTGDQSQRDWHKDPELAIGGAAPKLVPGYSLPAPRHSSR